MSTYQLRIKEATELAFMFDVALPTIGYPTLLPSGAKLYAYESQDIVLDYAYYIAGYAMDNSDVKCILNALNISEGGK